MPRAVVEPTPCPDPECKEGRILVFNIYNPDPRKGEWEVCDVCRGSGVVVRKAHEVH